MSFFSGVLAPVGLLSLLPLAPACGAAAESEMFSESTEALAGALGEACESTPVGSGEISIDDDAVCEPGLCVLRDGEEGADEGIGLCTCRCDGPEGTGPFCSCGDGFQCEHLIDDLGLSNRDLVGSYCMPE